MIIYASGQGVKQNEKLAIKAACQYASRDDHGDPSLWKKEHPSLAAAIEKIRKISQHKKGSIDICDYPYLGAEELI
jgi:hypothetical protein